MLGRARGTVHPSGLMKTFTTRLTLALICHLLIGSVSADDAAIPRYAIAIHGGAGSAPSDFTADQNIARHDGLKKALEAGQEILAGGGTALSAVEAVIRILEDDPLFNAGRGAVLNAEGSCELDASIMDGRNKACGAVAGTTVARNPISLARLVMTDTRHVLLAAGGADAFAKEKGVPVVPRDYFVTEEQKERWEESRNRPGGAAIPAAEDLADRIGTVGCVALDSHGNLAAGTSTGGLMMKNFGRVGDSPIIGAGTYADNATCAVSCTGVGEEFIRNAIAYDISAQMKYASTDLKSAVSKNLRQILKPGYGGIIALDHIGNIVMDYNTKGMACAAADSSGRSEVRWPRGKAEDVQSR